VLCETRSYGRKIKGCVYGYKKERDGFINFILENNDLSLKKKGGNKGDKKSEYEEMK
jgi:hypothetical protein